MWGICAGEKSSHIKISKSDHPVNINPHNIPGFIRLTKPILIPFHDVNKDPEQGQLNLNISTNKYWDEC